MWCPIGWGGLRKRGKGLGGVPLALLVSSLGLASTRVPTSIHPTVQTPSRHYPPGSRWAPSLRASDLPCPVLSPLRRPFSLPCLPSLIPTIRLVLRSPESVSMASREDSVYMAKLAEQAERYDEMVTYMKDVAKVCLLPLLSLDHLPSVRACPSHQPLSCLPLARLTTTARSRTHHRGAQSSVSRLQERHRGSTCQLADRELDRAEGRG